MSERDKEYYNRKIGELYSVIENQEKIIRDLQEEKQQLKRLNRNKDTRNSRQRVANAKLIKENKKLKDKLPIIIRANKCEWVMIEKWKDIICVNYKILKEGVKNERNRKNI